MPAQTLISLIRDKPKTYVFRAMSKSGPKRLITVFRIPAANFDFRTIVPSCTIHTTSNFGLFLFQAFLLTPDPMLTPFLYCQIACSSQGHIILILPHSHSKIIAILSLHHLPHTLPDLNNPFVHSPFSVPSLT